MLSVSNLKVFNIARAVYSARNAMNSWVKSDSDLEKDILGENDLDLAQRLFHAGPEHAKFMRQIFVTVDIVAPMYWWLEFDTYKVGTTSNSCSKMHTLMNKQFEISDFSFDHLIYDFHDTSYCDCSEYVNGLMAALNNLRKEYLAEKDDRRKKQIWYTIIQLLPESYNQRRTVSMSYANLANMIPQREHHKLDEWREYCEFMLVHCPYLMEIMRDKKGA